jgi:hypothetical protein
MPLGFFWLLLFSNNFSVIRSGSAQHLIPMLLIRALLRVSNELRLFSPKQRTNRSIARLQPTYASGAKPDLDRRVV